MATNEEKDDGIDEFVALVKRSVEIVKPKTFSERGRWLRYGHIIYRIKKEKQQDVSPSIRWELVERTTRVHCGGLDSVDVAATIKYASKPTEIVLILNYRAPVDKICLELPAGLIDKGETALQAAVRELKEETGLDASSLSTNAAASVSTELFVDPWKSTENFALVQLTVDGDAECNNLANAKQSLETDELIHVLRVPLQDLLTTIRRLVEKYDCGVDGKLYLFATGLQMAKQLSA